VAGEPSRTPILHFAVPGFIIIPPAGPILCEFGSSLSPNRRRRRWLWRICELISVMRGTQYLLSARDEVLRSDISRLRRRRMLHIMEGEDNFCFPFVWLMCLSPLDGSVKGCFVLLSSCTGHLVLALHDHQILNVLFISLKKKELFNVKEAHNHSFCLAVCGSPHFPGPLFTGPQTANWGWYYNLNQTCDN
jgi:hypothetical protein